MNIIIWIIIIILAIIILWLIVAYNGLVRLRQRVREGLSDIDVQLKRRHDLIPNLIKTVQGYATHEKDLLVKVTEARTAAMGAQGTSDKMKTENMLSQTLKSLFAVSENYPDLKASQNFLQLQDELSDTENKVQAARRFYNGQVRDLNTKVEVFPTNIFAKSLGFKQEEYFELDDKSERQVPEVNFEK